MPKKKKEEKGKKGKKGKKDAPETTGAAATIVVEADGQIVERVPDEEEADPIPESVAELALEPAPELFQARILDAWVGSGVRLKHPINLNGAFAVGSTTGQLEATDDRGVLLRLKRDMLQFYPWNCVYAISPDEKGTLD